MHTSLRAEIGKHPRLARLTFSSPFSDVFAPLVHAHLTRLCNRSGDSGCRSLWQMCASELLVILMVGAARY